MVYEKDPGGLQREVRAEKNFPDGLCPTFEFGDHNLDFPFERFAFDNSTEKGYNLTIDFSRLRNKHLMAEIMDVHLAIKFLFPATSAFLRSGIEVLQHSARRRLTTSKPIARDPVTKL